MASIPLENKKGKQNSPDSQSGLKIGAGRCLQFLKTIKVKG